MPNRLLSTIVFVLLLFPASVMAAPTVFYTDIVTGPNTGGENNQGAYLTIFGSGFGATRGSSQVTINNIPVAAYKQWSDAKITVQPGASVTSGVIRVMAGGVTSSSTQTFTVVPGDIYFVALNGNNSTGVIGDINHPFRTIQTVLDRSDFGPGDHLVVRGGNWSDVYDMYGSFFSIHHKEGTAAAPLVVMGYPAETVNLIQTTQTKGIHSWATLGHYVIANFHMDCNQHGLGIGITPGTTDVRIVNNEVKDFFEDSGGAATIDGSGKQYRIFGNLLHDNGGSKLYHAIYMDARDTTGVNDIEIAYNHVYNQTGGRGIQIYGDTGTLINNVRIHHNLIHNIHLDGILLGDYTGTGIQVYNNVVYHTADPLMQGPTSDHGGSGSCLRLNSDSVVASVYNNTFSDCAVDGSVDSTGVEFQRAVGVTFVNNIVDTSGGSGYVHLSIPSSRISASNNAWFGAGAAPTWGTSGAVTSDPLFAGASTGNFSLLSNSPVIDRGSSSVNALVITDFNGGVRPQGNGYDIGAYESSGASLPKPQNVRVIRQ